MTAMSSICFPLVGGRVMRVTRLDACGRVVYGDDSQVVSDGFVSVAATANVDDGEEISVVNANGKKCISQPACPSLTNIGVEVTFCRVDPQLYAMVTGQEVVYNAQGVAVGFRVSTAVSPCDVGWALEVWSNVPGVACSDDPNAQGTYGLLEYPYLQGGYLGDYTIENDAVSFVVSGAVTKDGTKWGVGPYDVVMDSSSTAGPLLTPMGPNDHFHAQLTEVAPPEPSCGAIPLDDPSGAAATTATAGVPGTWGPEPAIRPANYEDLATGSVTASPDTAWSEGQYVVLGDGSEAYWDGTAWQSGISGGPVEPATTAFAGTPGSFDGIPPEVGTDILTLDAVPVTPWESGEYVEAGDGTSWYWDGESWAEGVAP